MSQHLKGIAYIEIYVAEGPSAVDHFVDGLKFQQIATAHGWRRHSVLVRSRDVQVVLTPPTHASGAVADYLAVHGDGVADVALYADDLPALLARARRSGLRIHLTTTYAAMTKDVRIARITGAGSVQHTLVPPAPDLLDDQPPGFLWDTHPAASDEPALPPEPSRPHSVDHLAWCLPTGTLEGVVAQYRETFGMRIIANDRFAFGGSVINSHVLQDRPASRTSWPRPTPEPDLGPGCSVSPTARSRSSCTCIVQPACSTWRSRLPT
ncbi:VOC family protein [Actinomadura litoris]|uniref:VOC domain-containing protein n=1 Tax=Actinomadura litoris TaxID=2678616 RepID=A0A7K1LAP5_9ACTN|nr:VOC family protein [Actinomadura litoris]MUN41507.1 hypothetical protein [Actinomadura litoris]